jgi:hypothetical protein
MLKLLMSMQHISLYTPCIAIILASHTCIFVIDRAEHGLEEPSAPAPLETGNPEQDQGKPQSI